MDKSKLLGVKPERVAVKMPDGEVVYVREISLAERIDVETRATLENAPSLAALIVCAATVSAAGQPLMSLDDAGAVDKLPARLVARLAKAAMKLNAIGPEAEEEVKKN